MSKSIGKTSNKEGEIPKQLGLFERKIKKHRRIAEFDYHRVGVFRGIRWVDEKFPKTAHTKTRWCCPQGHIWMAHFVDIQRGRGCPYCATRIPKTEVDYHKLAQSRGYQWLSGILPQTTGKKTRWSCSEEHVWEARYSDIRVGHGCPYCVGLAKKTRSDYHKLADLRGFQWAGDILPQNINEATIWQCSEEHTWEAEYNRIRNGRGCPYCAGLVPKTEEDYHELAKQLNYQWIGKELPINAGIKTWWICSGGHTTYVAHTQLKYHNGVCLECSGLKPKTETDYHELAQTRGYEWIEGKLPKNIKEKTLWLCPSGHTWETTYNSFHKGRNCPRCQNMVNGRFISSQQEWLCDLVDGELNVFVDGNCLDIVVKIDNHNICIEYDGWYWHKDQLDKDKALSEVLINSGWRVLRVKSGELLPEEQDIFDAIIRLTNGSTYEEIILDDWLLG